MSLVFDTLKLSKALGKAFTPEQAEVLTEALTVSVTEGIATKSDLAVTTADLKAAIADLRTKLKADIAVLRAEMIRWIVGAFAFNFIATAGLMFTIAKLVAAK